MTRTVAIGAVLGFTATVLALALWDRGGNAGVVQPTSSIDAGPVLLVNPRALEAVQNSTQLIVPIERRAAKVMLNFPVAGDAGP